MDILKKLLSRIPLATKIKNALEMHDYDNWKEGIYYGDAGKYTSVMIGVSGRFPLYSSKKQPKTVVMFGLPKEGCYI